MDGFRVLEIKEVFQRVATISKKMVSDGIIKNHLFCTRGSIRRGDKKISIKPLKLKISAALKNSKWMKTRTSVIKLLKLLKTY